MGCGGLGKTTVANQVYKNIAEKFDCQAFVSLSQNPDMVIVFQSILSQVMKDECGSTSSCDKELLITELRNFLKDKRYLKFIYKPGILFNLVCLRKFFLHFFCLLIFFFVYTCIEAFSIHHLLELSFVIMSQIEY